MSAQHTPGPWFWDSDPIKDDPLGRVRFRVVATGRTITQCYYPSGDGQAEADTKLIAVAPDLFRLLKVFVLMMDDSMEGQWNRDGVKWQSGVTDVELTPDGSVMLSHARAAICKAEGSLAGPPSGEAASTPATQEARQDRRDDAEHSRMFGRGGL